MLQHRNFIIIIKKIKNVPIIDKLFLPPEDFFGDFLARFVNAGTAGLAHRLGPYMSRILDLGIGVSLGGSFGGLSDCLGTGFDETLPPPFPDDPPEDPLPATLYGSSSLEPDPKGRMIGWLLLFMDTGPDCVLYRGVAENLNDSFVISYAHSSTNFHIFINSVNIEKAYKEGVEASFSAFPLPQR